LLSGCPIKILHPFLIPLLCEYDSVNVFVACRLRYRHQVALFPVRDGHRGLLSLVPTASREQLNADTGISLPTISRDVTI
jgi:hypothetical protein